MRSSLAYAINVLKVASPILNMVVPGAGVAVAGAAEAAVLVSESITRLEQMHSEKRDPTDAEWAELNGRIASLRTQLHTPE